MAIIEFIISSISQHLNLVIVAILLCTFIGVLSWFLASPKPDKNPFSVDSRKPVEELEKDLKARDKVLKQGFNVKNVPENLDAIVIGSGIGGLSTAAILAKVGKKVLVLEQHDQAGGCCHSFIEKGFEFDVGIHYIGEMRSNTITRILIDQITDGQLQWCDLEEEFDVVALGEPGKQKLYPFRAGGPTALKAALLEKFPKEEKAIDKFLAAIKEVRKNSMGMMMVKVLPKWLVRTLNGTGILNYMTSYFKYARRTVQEVLDEITDDMDLKAVLAYSWGDYGTDPSKGSFALHAGLINHYLYGASYPRGGSSEIAYTIIPLIERAGGRVLVRAPVTQILIDTSGKAIGVRVEKGSSTVDLHAPLIISDAGAVNTLTKLLSPEIARKSSISRLIGSKVDCGVACMSLFVGLDGTAEQLNIKPYNIWAYTGNDLPALAKEYMNRAAEDVGATNIPLLFVSFPSTKDPTFQERYPGKSVCTVVTLANWEWFSQWENERVQKRGLDYDAVKKDIANKMWEQVLAIYPQLADKVEYFDIGTPVTNKYYIGSARGEIYGLDHTAKRFGSPEVMMHLRPQTDIPNLLLTGQDVLCCGFAGAMYGGLMCAASALNRNLYDDLVKLRGQIKKSR